MQEAKVVSCMPISSHIIPLFKPSNLFRWGRQQHSSSQAAKASTYGNQIKCPKPAENQIFFNSSTILEGGGEEMWMRGLGESGHCTVEGVWWFDLDLVLRALPFF